MKTASLPPKTEAEVWMRILHPDEEMSPRAARAILGLTFLKNDVRRMHELSAKARAGMLTAQEDAEMNEFERVGSILSTLKSKLGRFSSVPAAALDGHEHLSCRDCLGTRSRVL
ncbi:MAG: hypothetical protein L0Y71_13355 [Gemmataceae bacterium]|nr:hypothetical protein [Gemmataceae bacterium]